MLTSSSGHATKVDVTKDSFTEAAVQYFPTTWPTKQ